MRVDTLALGSILKNFKLRVPTNQREYSWENDHVQTLFQDWAAAINEPDYFLGAIVAVTRDHRDELEIVDGQQRLATTAIFLAVIRDYLKSHNEPDMASAIEREFLITSTKDRRDIEPRLHLNLADNEFFKAKLTGGNPVADKPSHRLIEAAFEVARAHVLKIVAPHDPKKHGDVLNTVWVEFVQNRAKVILLQVSSKANAFRMFETLNDRGLKTTEADLVKNYLFGLAGDDRIDEAQDKWAAMRGTLEALGDDDVSTVTFLRHALILKRGYLREKDLYDNAQIEAKSPGTAISLLETFEQLAGNYIALFNPEAEVWRSYPGRIREALATIRLLNIQPMWPLMLAVAEKFEKSQAAISFRNFIAWQVRFLIGGATLTGGSIEVPLAKEAKRVFDGEIKTAAQLSAALAASIPSDERFKAAFTVATVSKPELARYYLRALERAAKGQSEPWYVLNSDSEAINLEHVLPKKPNDNWPQFDSVMAKADARRLGNLALLNNQGNRELGSASFAKKREGYGDCPYVLTSQISTVVKWDHDAIAKRQSVLAELALKAWPL